MGTVLGKKSVTLTCFNVGVLNLLEDWISSRFAAEVVIGMQSIYTFCLAWNVCGTWWARLL